MENAKVELHANTYARQQVRIAKVQQQRANKNAVRREQAAQQAFVLAVEQAAAEYGVPVPVLNVKNAPHARANSATQQPSEAVVVVGGVAYKPCKAVHALCETLPATASRKDMMDLCKAHGINLATAATQVGIYRKAMAN